MNSIDRISKAAQINQVLKDLMDASLDRDKILAHVREVEEGCRVFGIATEGKTIGRLKVELQAAIDREIGTR